MGKKLYVGNLSFSVTEDELNNLFGQHGDIESCRLITDRDTGRSKGFAFVEMANEQDAESAISELDGQDFEGRDLRVNEARAQAPRSGGGGRGGDFRKNNFSRDRQGYGNSREHNSSRY